MVRNCKLEPEPDAALHVVIARLLEAARALRADPAGPAGMPRLLQALRDYRDSFDHPALLPIPPTTS